MCRPTLFYGTAPVQEHPGEDRIRAADSPYGATVVVCRRAPDLEVLVLHRSRAVPDHEGDWAWTPPAGARFPAEPIADCAARELQEEVGLDLNLMSVGTDEGGWASYLAEAPPDIVITLDAEHDRYEWLPVTTAIERCLPATVAASIARAVGNLR